MEQVPALLRQLEVVVGTRRAAQADAPDITESEEREALGGSNRCGMHCSPASRQVGERKMIISPGLAIAAGNRTAADFLPTSGDPTLVKVLPHAFRWQRMLDEGRYGLVGKRAVGEKISPSYVSRIPWLTLPGPEMVEAILDGRQADGMTLPV